MIEIKFRDFYDQRYPAIEHYELYVLLNGTGDALYVGIRRQDIWQRWFGYEGHLFFDGKHIHGQSQVGQKVADHFPNSLEWKIQLWTHSDCARCCQDVLPTEHGANWPIDFLEPFMIQKLTPIMNIHYNQNQGYNY